MEKNREESKRAAAARRRERKKKKKLEKKEEKRKLHEENQKNEMMYVEEDEDEEEDEKEEIEEGMYCKYDFSNQVICVNSYDKDNLYHNGQYVICVLFHYQKEETRWHQRIIQIFWRRIRKITNYSP